MVGRRTVAFRPSPGPVRSSRPSPRQAATLVCALLAVASTVIAVSFLIRPSKARAFDLFYGTVYLNDNTAPVAVDLATGKPSVRLSSAYTQVSAKASGDLDVVPLSGGTLLLDNLTGEFNMVDSSGYVLKATGGGVQLPSTTMATTATGIAAGANAYIVRTGDNGTSVYLVGQSTVAAAAGGGKTEPRASAQLNAAMTAVATSAVSANGNLWLLAGPGPSRTIRQLSVPAGSNAGVALDDRDRGTVNGPSALAVSTVQPDGSGGDAVAVASRTGVQVFGPTGVSRTATLSPPAGLDRILPVTNAKGGFAFLYHGTAGWTLMRVGVTGAGRAGQTPLPDLAPTAALAVPAQSNGSLFTLDPTDGALWQIPPNGRPARVPTVSTYPILQGETSDFSSVTVLARGSRVIYNSRAKLEALTVFTDGSHQPVIIDKRTAFDLAPNGAAVLSNLQPKPSQSNAPPQSKPQQDQQITDKIDCTTTTQTPHIPVVQLVNRGARSVQLHWDYTLLDRQDCMPSTYTVSVQLVSPNAPPPPATLTVQGADGINVAGLFPDTEYHIVVSAYINGKSTPSAPLDVRTSVEGPAAPTNVTATPDDQGNWTVSWTSCGGIQDGCVPAASWAVIPQLCDNGAGLISAPANGTLVGDPTQHSFSLVYKGNSALLGRGLAFEVEGVGTTGTIGTPSTASSCAYSWSHPIPDNIQVKATTPQGGTSVAGTAAAKVDLTFTGDQVIDSGGVGAQFTYVLLSGGTTVNQVGPTTDTTASVSGVQPGQTYQVRVIVAPPKHSEAAVSLPNQTVSVSANWPALSVTTGACATGGSTTTCSLPISISGLTSAQAGGETFNLTDSSVLTCGSTVTPLTAIGAPAGFDPANTFSVTVNRLYFYKDCTVTVQLSENAGSIRDRAYFGGVASNPSQPGNAQIPNPALTDTASSFFTAQWLPSALPQVTITAPSDPAWPITSGWQLLVKAPDGTACGSTSPFNPPKVPVSFPQTIPVSLACIGQLTRSGWSVTVAFSFLNQQQTYSGVPVNGTAPQPVDLSAANFNAKWAGLDADGNGLVQLSYVGPAIPNGQTSQWDEKLTDPSGTLLAEQGAQPDPSTPITLVVPKAQLPTQPVSSGYQVTITYTDATAGAHNPIAVNVAGDSPT
jgi:hypothetical protein